MRIKKFHREDAKYGKNIMKNPMIKLFLLAFPFNKLGDLCVLAVQYASR
jgi:hypothetical protein